MNVNISSIYSNNMAGSKKVTEGPKRVKVTNPGDIATAIDKGTLTVGGVTLELSEEVRNAIKEARDRQQKANENQSMLDMLEREMENAKKSNEAAEEATDKQIKALEIARRIARGGRVPMKDEKLLLEYNPDLYKMAKNMAIMAKEHKKYKSLVKDEEDKNDMLRELDEEPKTSTRYQVQIDVSLGDTPTVEGVSEVAVEVESAL